MAKKAKLQGSSNEVGAEPNLTPLLDVVLQLIMFFMITVNLAASEENPVKIKLPIAQSLVPRDQDSKKVVDVIRVNIQHLEERRDGKLMRVYDQIFEFKEKFQTREKTRLWFVNEMNYMARLARNERPARDPNFLLVVRADRDVQYSFIFDVIEAARLAGIEKYHLRAESEQPGPKGK